VLASTEGVKKIFTGLFSVPNLSSAKAVKDSARSKNAIAALLANFMKISLIKNSTVYIEK
jgi:hypothetical protein